MAASGEEEKKSYRDHFDKTNLGFPSRFATIEEDEPLSSSEDVTKITNGFMTSNTENGGSSNSLIERTSSESVGGASDADRYVPPGEDPYQRAWKYLSKHDILHLFQACITLIFFKD